MKSIRINVFTLADGSLHSQTKSDIKLNRIKMQCTKNSQKKTP